MFNLTHILYMIISFILSGGILAFLYFKFNTEDKKVAALKFFAVITVVIHFSSLWVDFLMTGEQKIAESMLFPIHPCNVCMWLLLIVAFIKKREGIFYKLLSEFVFFGGTVCGFIGILLNENFDSNPTLLDYEVLKGLLSHSTMILGAVFLLVGGFVKIRVSNVFSVIAGLLFFVVDGFIINTLYSAFGREACNSMYLLEKPFSNMPWLTTPVMGLAAVILVLLVTFIYEAIALPREERFFNVIKNQSFKESLR